MQNELKVTAIQSNLHWHDIDLNLKSFEEKMCQVETSDIIVLPEMFSTGFTMNPSEVAEGMSGKAIRWMKEQASKKNAALLGSLVIKEKGTFFNRAVFVFPDGKVETYDKRHSFSLAGEHEKYTSGNDRTIVTYRGWRICPLICYDLRFPVWSRFNDDYDVLIYMANWPKPRILAWDSLLRARAIENMSYCIGVNRVGKDANDYEYNGHTSAFDCLGEQIAMTEEGEEDFFTITLNVVEQNKVRERLNFLNDRDEFTIKLI